MARCGCSNLCNCVIVGGDNVLVDGTGVPLDPYEISVDYAAGAATLYVAAVDASTEQKELADYVCDGAADDVQIQAAIAAAKVAGGLRVLLSPGTFTLAARILLAGDDDIDSQFEHWLEGCGQGNTRLVPASGLASAIHISACARVQLRRFGVVVAASSATAAITSTRSTVVAGENVGFWNSTIEDIQVEGPADTTHTGYAFSFGSPWRSTFRNLEAAGTLHGLRMFSENTNFSPGSCTVDRASMYLSGNNGIAYDLESTTSGGLLSRVEFRMCEAVASGTGCRGWYLHGTGEVRQIDVTGSKLELVDKALEITTGSGNRFEFTYLQLRGTASLTLLTFGTGAYDNWVRQIGLWYIAGVAAVLVNDGNTTALGLPNRVENVSMYADTSATITQTVLARTIMRSIKNYGPGTASAVVRSPNVIPRTPVTLVDAATIATDAAAGDHFRVTLGGNRTLGAPTNPVDGQSCVWELIQDGTGSRTITLNAVFKLGTDISAVTLTTTLNKRDFMAATYNAATTSWYVTAFAKGY